MNVTSSRLCAVALATAVGLTLSSCSKDDTTATPPATTASETTATAEPTESAPVPVVTPSTDPETNEVEYCDRDTEDAFTGPAADEFGAENVLDAYCEMVAFSFQQGFTTLMRPVEGRTVLDYSFVKPFLTDAGAQKWDELVAQYLAGDEAQRDAIFSLTAHDIGGLSDGYVIPESGPQIVGGSFSAADTKVDTRESTPRLEMTFDLYTNIVVTKPGLDESDLYVIPFAKRVRYTLVPTGKDDVPWAIDAWSSTYTSEPTEKYDLPAEDPTPVN